MTGGAVGDSESRLDFDIPEAGLDKDAITAKVNEMIGSGAAISSRWISDDELAANPSLVKTMSVKPPMGTGKVRLIEIAGLDLQPCGGTHVRNDKEIGAVRVTQIEKKGKQNRRVRLALADEVLSCLRGGAALGGKQRARGLLDRRDNRLARRYWRGTAASGRYRKCRQAAPPRAARAAANACRANPRAG